VLGAVKGRARCALWVRAAPLVLTGHPDDASVGSARPIVAARQTEWAPAVDPGSPLERALARFGAALPAKDGIEQGAG
jgi:hypothetical protein